MAMLLDSAATIDNDGDISLSVVETVIDVLMDLVEAAQIGEKLRNDELGVWCLRRNSSS